MDVLIRDLRLAARRFLHQPGFTAVVVLTLALGVGANTAIFTLIDALMLRSLPVERPEEIYRLGDTNNCCVNSGLQGSFSLFSSRLFEHLRANASDFVELAGFQANTAPVGIRMSGAAVPESLTSQFVTANYFRMFGIEPAAGRLLIPDDDLPSAPPVIVLSYRVWARFGLEPSIIGSTVLVNGRPMTVAGVAPQDFFGDTIRPDPAGVWIPMGQEPVLRGDGSLIERSNQHWLYAMGRLAPGAHAEAVSVRMTTALQQWLLTQPLASEQDRQQIPREHIVVTPAGGGVPIMQAQYARSLTLLLVTSAVLLLIAAANLANLLLARADRGQVAIRTALGASAGRLVRQSLTEGVVLALAGAAVGVLVAMSGTRALIALAFPGAQFVPVSVTPSLTTLLFASALAVVTGMLFSGLPALAMSRATPLDALTHMGRSGQGRSFVPRRSLVIVQVTLSFVMITSAGLLASSLGQLERQPLGFESANRVVLRLDVPASGATEERLALLYSRLQERIRRVPGVVNVSYALYSPMEGNNWSSAISIAGRAADPARPESSSWNRVGPQYFATVGTRVVRGRAIDERDAPGMRRVAVVSEAFAQRFFGDTDPVGQRLGIGNAARAGDFEIVGVVEDVKYANATQPVRPMMFLSAFQSVPYDDATARSVQLRSMLLRAIVIQTVAGAGNVEPALRSAVAEVDATVNITRVMSLANQVSANFRVERLMSRVTSLYGVLALVLASLGLYGVTAYTVAQRTREIGVRLALGADRTSIMRHVVGAPVLATGLGLILGVPLASVAANAIKTQLYGVDSQNVTVLAIAGAVLLATAALAAALPAVRAASIDPSRALRTTQ